jgi:SAM-dependent methyltransferase
VSVDVLKSKHEVDSARARMESRGISCLGLETTPPTFLQRLLRRRPPGLGDRLKSWDVLRTAEFIEQGYPRTARVLDLGAFNSEVLCVLHRMGFERLTGVDLNPEVRRMPFSPPVRWEVGNFLRAPFPDHSFDVVTAISVIEHGYDPAALLGEISRLLAPGGAFVASFDYWPDKIDTKGTRFFGMDWLIFSRQDVLDLVAAAAAHGLDPCGPLQLDGGEPTVACGGFDYTFGWLALRKR